MTGIAAALRLVDERLREINRSLKRTFRLLRVAQVALILGLLGTYALAVLAIVYPQHAGYYYAGAIVILSTAMVPWIVLISVPLRLRSVRRLVDKGYPKNAKELAIRLAAKKLHEESIETEELLFETALNEGKKAYRKYKARQAAEAAQEAEDAYAAAQRAQRAAQQAAQEAARAARGGPDDLQPRP